MTKIQIPRRKNGKHSINQYLQGPDKLILKKAIKNGEKLDAVLEKLENMDCSASANGCEKGCIQINF